MHESDESPQGRAKSEMMVGVVVLLGSALVALAFFYWKRGSDRAGCILNIRNVQQAVRGYEGMQNQPPGEPINWSDVVGPRGYMKKPVCPAGGVYRFKDRYPAVGALAMECSLCDAPEKHEPPSHADW